MLENSFLGKNSVVMWSVVCEGCILGEWSRVEGEAGGGVEGDKIAILGLSFPSFSPPFPFGAGTDSIVNSKRCDCTQRS